MSQTAETIEKDAASEAPSKPTDTGHETVVIEIDTNYATLPGKPVAHEDAPPEVPGCKILSVLGKGGMGTVFLAQQENLRRLVAIKVLRSRFSENPRFVKSLSQEALTLGALSHPNIVSCHDVITLPDGIAVVMEYVPGSLTGRDLVHRLGPVPEGIVVEILRQTVRALAYVFSKGYIHRDLKPDNLLFYRDALFPPRTFDDIFSLPSSRVMICDFGIAAKARIVGYQLGATFFGSPAFMAPEQALTPEKVDFRADIYALAGTAWYLLMGKEPFVSQDRERCLLMKAQNDMPDPVPDNGHRFSKELLVILRKMGACSPDDRYQKYSELLADLESLSLVCAERSKKLPSKVTKRKRSFFLGLLLGVMLLAAVLGTTAIRNHLAFLEEMNYVSKTMSFLFWDGEQDGWRIFQKDEGSEFPSMFGVKGASALTLREVVHPGTFLKFNIRLHGHHSTSVSFVNETNELRAKLSFFKLPGDEFLVLRLNVEGADIPVEKIHLRSQLQWTKIKVLFTKSRLWVYVNGELNCVRQMENRVDEWKFQIDPVESNYIQLKDVMTGVIPTKERIQ